MGDDIEKMSAMGGNLAEQEALPELSKKGQEMDTTVVHDGGDPATASMEALKTPPKKDLSRGTSPSKRTSKRRRKNRRRREKRAALNASGTGTETEFSQNSEEVSKGDDSGGTATDTEMDLDSSSVGADATFNTVTSEEYGTPVGGRTTAQIASPACAADFSVMGKRNQEEGASSAAFPAPAYEVETLLQIAKDKMNEISKGGAQSERDHGHSLGDGNNVAPPCSPSSAQTLDDAGTEPYKLAERQKSYTKSVHFDEGPPAVVPAPVDFNRSLGEPFELDQQQVFGELSKLAQSKSKETVILVENVGPSESVTSSVGSMESAGSLLRGNGSSCEDVAEPGGTSYHYPSRETVERDQAAIDASFNVEDYKETIQLFKMQNPEATRSLGEEIDLVMTRSLETFSNLLSRSKSQQKKGEPLLLSYKQRDEDSDLPEQQQLAETSVLEVAGDVTCPGDVSQLSGFNATFTIDPEEEGACVGSQSPGPGMQEEMSTTLEREYNADLSIVYEVPEEDRTLDLDLDDKSPQPYESVSEASTLIEAVSVQHIPSDNATQRQSESEGQADDPDAIYDSDEENLTRAFIAETESEMDSEEGDAEDKKPESVQLLTLHFPPTATATAGSHQDTNLEGGDQPYMHMPSSNNNANPENDITGSGQPSPVRNEMDYRGDNYDTESDCPWLPERAESLTKVISEREKRENAAKARAAASPSSGSKQGKKGSLKRSKSGSSPGSPEDNLDDQGQGCNCAKMCVIM